MNDIIDWLEGIGLGKYAQAFAENEIDLEVLPELSEQDLEQIGLPLGPRRKLQKAIAELGGVRATAATAPPEPTASTAPPEPAAPQGERRQVTVMFADLSGYTKLSSGLDAEETHALLNQFFAAVDRVVTGYGGTIDKHIGDAVMAVFGAPVAHTNDPERAVRAALDTHKAVAALDPPLQVHIGIASGQVVASGTGSDDHREYTMTGDSVNLASRLTSLAATNETLVSDAVQSALADRFVGESLGAKAIEGLSQPVTVWRLEELGAAAMAHDHPFVGRRRELRQFESSLEDCLQSSLGQSIYVRGEAGIGKTRLIEEFQRLAEEAGFETHAGLILDFGVGKGQDAIRALVRSLLDVPFGSGKDVRKRAAERVVADALVEPRQRAFLNDLLDLDQPEELSYLYESMENAARNRGKQETVAALVRQRSQGLPLLLRVENVHWADAIVLDHLSRLAATVAELPVLLVMTSRIEGDQLDQGWRSTTGGAPLSTIDLSPLRDTEALDLARDFLDIDRRVAAACVERAEGNPLFLEQLLRSAMEATEEAIPGSVQSIVQSRMDRLAPEDRDALQAASVLGQRFSVDALRHVIGAADYGPENLVVSHLVRPHGSDYLFSHALIRDGVYASLLTNRRRDLHHRASDWFSDQDLMLHAQHLEGAGDPGAPGAYLAAARNQIDAYRFDSAMNLADKGLVLDPDSATLFELICFKGDLLRDLGQSDRSIETFEQALEAATTDTAICRANIGLAEGMRIVDRYEEGLAVLDRAQQAAEAINSTSDLAHVYYLRGNYCFPLGRIDDCLSSHERAIDYAREAGAVRTEVGALSGLGDANFLRGRMLTAHGYYDQAVKRAEENRLARDRAANLHQRSITFRLTNRPEAALEDAIESRKEAARIFQPRSEVCACIVISEVKLSMGDFDDALDAAVAGIRLAQDIGSGRFEAQLLDEQCRALLALGEKAKARDLAKHALNLALQFGPRFCGPKIYGTLAVASDDDEETSRHLAEGERLLAEDCVSHNHFYFYPDAMEMALAMSDWDEAERYADALEVYTGAEPLPYTDFCIARGRALAAFGRGKRDDATMRELKCLRDEAERVGLKTALSALDEALEAG